MRVFFIYCAIVLSISGSVGCVSKTPNYHIMYAGESPITDEQVTPLVAQIDGAAMTVAMALGIEDPPAALSQILVTFHKGPLMYQGVAYGGLTTEQMSRVLYTPPCEFDSLSLTHELMHALLWIKTGDTDGEHKAPQWPWVPMLNASLRMSYCGP